MTVRTKQQPAEATSAKILELPVSRKSSAYNSVSLHSRPPANTREQPSGAALLSIRQHLTFKGSLVFSDLEFIEQKYSVHVANKLIKHVRELLDHEFGSLRVHRRRQAFVISHHCMDTLVAGLLRVQFHSCQIPLPTSREGNRPSDMCGVSLCWGTGQTLLEAEAQRLQKQKS